MSLKPKRTKKQLMKQRARKGAATKLQQKKLEKMQAAKKIIQEGGDVFDVCSGLDCVLQEGLKIVRDVNRILQKSGEVLSRRQKEARQSKTGMSIDEIAERVFNRVLELTGQKKP